MDYLTYSAPAKLNLFLHVIGQRADGYHLLQTVFQFLDYADELKFRLRDDTQIHFDGNFDAPNNIILKVARVLQAFSEKPCGIDIKLHKKIPVGGGLGGGSSNAATTLIALNKLWQLNLSPEQLMELGAQLGADIPIFIHGHAAFAENIGEKLTDITLPEPWYVILHPGISISTHEIFSAQELTRNTPAITIQQFLAAPEKTNNDCLRVARTRYPELSKAWDWLNQHALARLTGTGSCLFAAVESQQKALAIAEKIPAPWSGFVARGLNKLM